MQYDAMANIVKNLSSLSNPLVFVFFLAEFLLLFTLFQKHPNRKLILTGTLLLLPYALLALFGGLAGRPKIIVSTLPFLAMSIAFFFKFRSFNQPSESHGAK